MYVFAWKESALYSQDIACVKLDNPFPLFAKSMQDVSASWNTYKCIFFFFAHLSIKMPYNKLWDLVNLTFQQHVEFLYFFFMFVPC